MEFATFCCANCWGKFEFARGDLAVICSQICEKKLQGNLRGSLLRKFLKEFSQGICWGICFCQEICDAICKDICLVTFAEKNLRNLPSARNLPVNLPGNLRGCPGIC